ncbi:helix-turn-helix transcriptional regulator [Paenibacillus chibensis]|uniref:helix-turn-helix transcriptional regulator n=1 Tax=Paenibacillus chibensis TaxID=59846 RepID=UPI000FDC61C9|nr:AraC family transcriptional regulator [Paenibacillus chibensis]MEC0369644.1 AraC family transcriptional regulator [Paenibacillus chibensis]
MIEILEGTRETVSYSPHFRVRLYLNQETENYPIHWHPAAEVIMPLENIYTAVVIGERHVLNPGDIIVIPPGELHELFAPDSGKRIILQFDSAMLYQLEGFSSSLSLLGSSIVIRSGENNDLHASLKALLLRIMNEYFSDQPLKEAAAFSLLIQFFVQLGRNYVLGENRFPNTRSRKQHAYVEMFLEICAYINDHCTEDITIDHVAERAGFSKFHFIRLFKQFTGSSYYTYLNKRKIMHAEKLLMDPNITITEVAMKSGFVSLATFNRVFKSYKKCTPSQFKNLEGIHRTNP